MDAHAPQSTPPTDPSPELREAWGHPRGLFVLAGTELWDRISFHGMQALLVLYMVEQLLLPGHVEHIVGFPAFRGIIESVTGPLSVQALAAQIFGLYVGLVYFTPVLGGWLGDRVLGRKGAVALGALLMTAGHFALAFDASFLLALLLLICGAGSLRGNLTAQVDSLYGPEDRRRADAFQIYYSMVNAGAFIAPILTGWLGKKYGWHAGFGFAGFGMLIGLVIYLAGSREVPRERSREAAGVRAPLTADERRRLLYLAALLPITTSFWIAQSQVWNVYNLWARDHVNLTLGSFTMPVPWLQAIDGLAPLLTMPPLVWFWRWQARRGGEPDQLRKIGLGCLIFAAGTAWLALGDVVYAGTRVPLLWAIAFHLLSNVGWLYFAPIVVAVFAHSAPPAVRGTMLGVNLLATFFGSLISGRLGGLYESWSPQAFWLLHTAIVAAGGIAVLILGGVFRRGLEPPK